MSFKYFSFKIAMRNYIYNKHIFIIKITRYRSKVKLEIN